jgi:3-isopropylmalate dehydrogenase
MHADIIVLAGDGIGPEVTGASEAVLHAIAARFGHSFAFAHELIGGISIDTFGSPLTKDVIGICKKANAVLLGAVGGPKWDNPAAHTRPEAGLLALRKELGLFANLRPVKPHPLLLDSSPVKPERLQNVDLIVVRELTGGLYFGEPKGRERMNGYERAVDTLAYSDVEIRRVVECAFSIAEKRRKKVTSVDKANVLETSRLWRQTALSVAGQHPEIKLEHMLVDTASMRLIATADEFDVLVTENMFGDILTDEASVLAGSMGMLPSASLGDGGPGLYEPIHGSAPDIAGKGIANPVGAILSTAMLLRHSLSLEDEALAVERAVDCALQQGLRTKDLGGSTGTKGMTEAIITTIRK